VTRVLVSGVAALVQSVSDRLRADGADVDEVTKLADVPATCASAGAGVYDAYVQLPSTFQPTGETAIDRVYSFYADGVLARFGAMKAALPSLATPARLVFVMGILPPDVASDQDVHARRALTNVLAQAARADRGERPISVRMLDSSADPADIAAEALGTAVHRDDLPATYFDDDDWRIEMLGLASIEL
jgi:hypothetical protein